MRMRTCSPILSLAAGTDLILRRLNNPPHILCSEVKMMQRRLASCLLVPLSAVLQIIVPIRVKPNLVKLSRGSNTEKLPLLLPAVCLTIKLSTSHFK